MLAMSSTSPIWASQQSSKRDQKMSRSNRHRRKGSLGSFVALPKYLLQSLAWRTLKPVPRAAFVELVDIYNGVNNGWLGMSVRNLATAINVSRATAARALQELTERGFIEQTRRSAFSCKVRLPSEWRLTLHRCDRSGELPSKAFTRWRPEEQNTGSSKSQKSLIKEPAQDKCATTLLKVATP
jgi:IclR helix-turn-helix domain